MSLVRNFTKRARAHTRSKDDEGLPRSCSVRYAPGTINRAKISLPTELLSTTNVHALNAPDIRKVSGESITSSADSINSDNDFFSIDKGFLSADNSSSVDLSPITPLTPFSDLGLSSDTQDFFSSKPITSAPTPATEPVPAIPQRAPSHSKKAHVELSRQRSFNRSLSPPPTNIVEQTTTRDTVAFFSSPRFSSPQKELHPFGRELAKVDEVAETFRTGLVLDEEEHDMMTKGLRKFTVDDYLAEITGLTGGIYEDHINLNPWM